MLYLVLNIALFFIGSTILYIGVQYLDLHENAVYTTAVVMEIEEEISRSDEGMTYTYAYYVHLKLPDYHGVPLGKRYETPIAAYQYSDGEYIPDIRYVPYKVGEILEIVQNRDAPTEIMLLHDFKKVNTKTFVHTFNKKNTSIFFVKRPTLSLSYNTYIIVGILLLLSSFSGCYIIGPYFETLPKYYPVQKNHQNL
jgi:hypothetical protein